MIALDSRRYHRRRGPALARLFSKNEQSTAIRSPFGEIPFQTAGMIGRQQVNPLLLGLGLGTGPAARRLQRQIESGRAQGPLASAIREIQRFAPDVLPQSREIGARVAREGEQAVQGLQREIARAQAALPQYQQAAQKGLGGARQALTGSQQAYARALEQLPGLQAAAGQGLTGTQRALGSAQRTLSGAEAALPGLQAAAGRGLSGAEEALGLASGYTRGPAITGAEAAVQRAQELLRGGAAQTGAAQALGLAQRYAERAASPIGQQDLYNVAARRVLQQARPGLAARGLEAGGAGAQLETEALRNLTFDFAQRRAAEQQQTLQALGQQAQGLGGLQQAAIGGLGQTTGQLGALQQAALAGLGQAAGGVQEAAARSAQLPQTLLPLIQALTGAGQGVGQAALTSGQVGQSILPYLQAIQQGAGGVSELAGQGAQLATAGVPLAAQGAQAVQQLGQTLLQQSGIPMQQAGQLLNLLTAGTQPGLSLLGQTGPIPTTSGKGFRII